MTSDDYKIGDLVEVAGHTPFGLLICGMRGTVTYVDLRTPKMLKVRFDKWPPGRVHGASDFQLLPREVRLVSALDLVAEAAK